MGVVRPRQCCWSEATPTSTVYLLHFLFPLFSVVAKFNRRPTRQFWRSFGPCVTAMWRSTTEATRPKEKIYPPNRSIGRSAQSFKAPSHYSFRVAWLDPMLQYITSVGGFWLKLKWILEEGEGCKALPFNTGPALPKLGTFIYPIIQRPLNGFMSLLPSHSPIALSPLSIRLKFRRGSFDRNSVEE